MYKRQDSPIVESVQSLTYKTVKIHFSETLNDEHIRQLQGFILAQAGIYSYIGTSTCLLYTSRRIVPLKVRNGSTLESKDSKIL